MKDRCVTIDSVMGHMAQWVVRQSPFHSTRGVDQVNQTLFAACGDWGGHVFRYRYFSSQQAVEDWISAQLSGNEWLTIWNCSMVGRFANAAGAECFAFTSSYYSPRPETDFIDIDALLRNVSRSVWGEAGEYERSETPVASSS